MEDGKRSPWTYVAVGCGGLVLLGVIGSCVGPAIIGAFLAWQGGSAAVSPPVPVTGQNLWTPDASAGGAGPMLPEPPGQLQPSLAGSDRPVTMTVTLSRASGPEGLAAGHACTAVVRPPARNGQSLCQGEVRCGDRVLYGGSSNGYFGCEIQWVPSLRVTGRDDATASEDGDAAIEIDTTTELIRVRDDATGPHGVFEIEGRVVQVQ